MKRMILDDLWQDVRTSLRALRRAPVVTLTILATVGLGIGATDVMFTAVDAAMFRPLPYTHPEQLVRIYTDAPPYRFRFSVADYLALEAQQTQFTQIAAYTSRTMGYSDGSMAERLDGKLVSWTYFDLLDITPVLGRRFSETDGRPGSLPAVIVSHRIWRERLGGRTDAIGAPVRLDGTDYTVVGVLPRKVGPFEYGQDFFVAARFEPPPRKGPFLFTVLARLAPKTDRGVAAAELREVNRRIFPLWKSSYQDERATWGLMDLQTYVTGESATAGALALGAVALVWLIACANASNLMIARVTGRRRELAVRGALGASRARILRHLLVESACLAVGAGLIGLVIAWAGMDVVRVLGANYLLRTEEVVLDQRALLVLAVLAVVSALIFGVIPAAKAAGKTLDESLRAEGRTSTGSAGVRRLRQLLVGSQFAVATPLLIVAALLLVSLERLNRVDIGFDTGSLLTASIQLPTAQYREPASTTPFWEELERRLEAIPEVEGVAFANGRPPADVGDFNNFDLEQFPTPAGQSQPVTPWVGVTPDYFRVLGLALVEGRLLDDRDGRGENLDVIVVDRAWAKRFFPNESAVGKRLRGGGCSECPWTTVVGVVTEVKYAGLDAPDEGTVYWPLVGERFRNVVLRTRTGPAAAIPGLRQVLRELDPTVPLASVATADELVAQSLEGPRSLSVLVACLGAVALLLSMIGIYGVMAYYVQQHTREMGIRLALGGSPGDVLRLVVARGAAVVVIGLAAGLTCALILTRWISSLLFEIESTDAATYAVVSLVLLIAGILACVLPGRRAMRLEPAVVLRND